MHKTLLLGELISAEHAELSSAMVQRNTYTWILQLEVWRNMFEAWM
jgi:hypothetical protein